MLDTLYFMFFIFHFIVSCFDWDFQRLQFGCIACSATSITRIVQAQYDHTAHTGPRNRTESPSLSSIPCVIVRLVLMGSVTPFTQLIKLRTIRMDMNASASSFRAGIGFDSIMLVPPINCSNEIA